MVIFVKAVVELEVIPCTHLSIVNYLFAIKLTIFKITKLSIKVEYQTLRKSLCFLVFLQKLLLNAFFSHKMYVRVKLFKIIIESLREEKLFKILSLRVVKGFLMQW